MKWHEPMQVWSRRRIVCKCDVIDRIALNRPGKTLAHSHNSPTHQARARGDCDHLYIKAIQ